MNETVFFENGDVKVTNARFVVGRQTYAMNGVTSVASSIAPPNRAGLIVGVVIGLLILLGADGSGKAIGVIIALVCGIILYRQKATHAIVLRSSSGEFRALTSTDGDHIGAVVSALNESLVHRG